MGVNQSWPSLTSPELDPHLRATAHSTRQMTSFLCIQGTGKKRHEEEKQKNSDETDLMIPHIAILLILHYTVLVTALLSLLHQDTPNSRQKCEVIIRLLNLLEALPLSCSQDGAADVSVDMAAHKRAPSRIPERYLSVRCHALETDVSEGEPTLRDGGDCILALAVLPENKSATRLQQLPNLLHDGARIVDSAHDLNAQDGVHASLRHSLCPENVAVLDAAGEKLVAGLEFAVLQLLGNVVLEVGVRVDGVNKFNELRVKSVDLVARAGTKLEDLALGLLDKRWDNSGAFVLNKALG